MKGFTIFILSMITAIMPSWAAKGYEMEVRNLVQVNETEFTFDIRMKNTNASEPFAIEAIQWQLSFNTALMNGGSLNDTYLTYVEGTTDLVGADIIPNSDNFSTTQVIIQWVTASLGNGAQTTYFGDTEWKRIGTFKVQLRNSGNTAFLNFADVAHSLAFVPSQVIVNWCNYTTSSGLYYRDGAYFEIISNKTLTNSLSSRLLAGYCFTGTGSWSATARWNNVTTANANTIPGSSNNALIAGAATVSDTRTTGDVTVASGGYLVVAPGAKLTAGNLYNDNLTGGGGTATNAGWDFENTSKVSLPYTADNGTSLNINVAPMTTTASFVALTAAVPGGTRVVMSNNFYTSSGFPPVKVFNSWNIQLTTTGYQSLKISSKQWSDNGAYGTSGPTSFKIQYSLNGTTWTDIPGGTVTVAENWTSGVVNNLNLPTQINDLSTVYIRWLNDGSEKSGYSAIDDIIISGTALPTGINIQSSGSGAGSLIHNTTGVEATVERYIAGWTDANHGWHFLSSPVAQQPISVFHTAGSGNDFYKWVEDEDNLKKWVNRTATGGVLNTGFETNFAVGTNGYLIANATESTPLFTGVLNVASVPISGLTNTSGSYYAGWHLLGNPFPCALKYNQGTWARSNMGAYAQIWRESTASYAVLNGTQEIPPMNGFMVYTTGNGSITIPADARIHTDTNWYKSGEAENQILLIAEDPEGMTAQETKIAVNESATDGFDLQYDSYYMAGFAPVFYSKSGGSSFALNTLPELKWDMIIPLGFVKNTSTSFSIRLAENNTGRNIFLRDLKLNKEQNLTSLPVYSFTSAEGDAADRFQLRFSGVGIEETAAQTPVCIYGSGQTIYIASKTGKALQGKATVYNLMGKTMKTQSLSAGAITTIAMNAVQGYYLVKVNTPDQIFSGKVFLN